MAVAQQPNEQPVDHAGLTDNHLAELHAQEVNEVAGFADAFVQRADVRCGG